MATVDNPIVSPSSDKDENPQEKGFFNRPRAGGKTMWDWLNLLGILAIPLMVGAATIGFGLLQLHLADMQHQQDQQSANLQHIRDQQSTLDQQRAAILQTYIDNIQDLLLNHNLLKSQPGDNVAILARARTVTALQGLDPERQGHLVQFIYEARLIGFMDITSKPNGLIFVTHGKIIDLSGANLSGARLRGADLREVYLRVANLSGADFNNANLFGAYLSYANLTDAGLSRATLRSAVISRADLSRADLSYANLTDAILSGATLISARLNGADLSRADLSGANLTDADLGGTRFSGADLSRADLSGANLTDTDLSGTRFSGDTITQQQLDQVYSCKNAMLPQGLTCHRTLSP